MLCASRLAIFYHTNTKLDTLCIFSQTGPRRRVNALAPLRDYRRKVFFSRTQRYTAQFRNQTKCRQPCSCQLALLSTELHRRKYVVALSVFLKDTRTRYDQCRHRTSNLTINIRRSSRLSYDPAKSF